MNAFGWILLAFPFYLLAENKLVKYVGFMQTTNSTAPKTSPDGVGPVVSF